MYCTACGKEMKTGDRFCAQCGNNAGEQAGQRYTGARPPRLMRSMKDSKIAGVCSGIARQYDWDVTLVRVAFLLGIVLHGLALLVYLVAWATMPRDDAAVGPVNYGGA